MKKLILLLIICFSNNSSLYAEEIIGLTDNGGIDLINSDFDTFEIIPASYGRDSVRVADINNDGYDDIIINTYLEQIEVYQNLGDYNFQLVQTITPKDKLVDLEVTDLNRDGFADIIYTRFDEIKNYDDNATGSVVISYNYGGVFDAQGLNYLDTSSGSLGGSNPPSPFQLFISDKDNDGFDEVFLTIYDVYPITLIGGISGFSSSTKLVELKNFQLGGFPELGEMESSISFPREVKFMDFNGDSKLDRLTYNGGVLDIEYDGLGEDYHQNFEWDLDTTIIHLSAGDYNNDNISDVFLITQTQDYYDDSYEYGISLMLGNRSNDLVAVEEYSISWIPQFGLNLGLNEALLIGKNVDNGEEIDALYFSDIKHELGDTVYSVKFNNQYIILFKGNFYFKAPEVITGGDSEDVGGEINDVANDPNRSLKDLLKKELRKLKKLLSSYKNKKIVRNLSKKGLRKVNRKIKVQKQRISNLMLSKSLFHSEGLHNVTDANMRKLFKLSTKIKKQSDLAKTKRLLTKYSKLVRKLLRVS